ncbi:thiamine pyrophosphate-binding protein [Xanthobacter sp. KR7-225]|uniref:thiamine pyrophosphate-binding protein n=1 Tax=Xanthobacter sp. KR7-225 TaxID=3156613 RepID=UPI0032B31BC3
MTQMNGGAAIVEALRAAGVTHVFGLLGSSTMELYDALYDAPDITYVGVRDERSGTHMADAYARVSGRPGVILAGQAGPGATNLVTGLAQAMHAFSPVVAIAGTVSTDHVGRAAFQEVDQQALFTPVTKRTVSVPRGERLPEFVKEAFRVALAERRGPVVLNIPRDMFAQQMDVEPQPLERFPVTFAGTTNPAEVAQVARLLRGARAPVILAGAGVKKNGAWRAVARLAERLQIPVALAAGHGDALPNDQPCVLGQVGPRGNPVASRATREADVILALGARLGFNTTFFTYNDISRDARIVQVDVSADYVSRYFPTDVGFVGDPGAVAEGLDIELADLSPPAGWRERMAGLADARDELWRAREEAGRAERTPYSAERVFAELRRAMPRDAIVTLDAGTMCLQATDQLRYYTVPSLITPLDFGLVGFSYAAGLGAKAAAPERPVVSLMGDGGFAMNMAEITTAVEAHLPTVCVVLDNGCWGAEKAYQRDFYNGRYIGADITSPPYDKVAELCGANGYRAEKPGELSAALEAALASGRPSVIHAKVDANAIVSFRRDAFKHRGAAAAATA